jgi:hypothetical protein
MRYLIVVPCFRFNTIICINNGSNEAVSLSFVTCNYSKILFVVWVEQLVVMPAIILVHIALIHVNNSSRFRFAFLYHTLYGFISLEYIFFFESVIFCVFFFHVNNLSYVEIVALLLTLISFLFLLTINYTNPRVIKKSRASFAAVLVVVVLLSLTNTCKAFTTYLQSRVTPGFANLFQLEWM